MSNFISLPFVLTPKFYGRVTKENFPLTFEEGGMQHQHRKYKKGGGVSLQFLKEFLNIEDHKEAIIIISIGTSGELGCNEEVRKFLRKKVKDREILGFEIEKNSLCVKIT